MKYGNVSGFTGDFQRGTPCEWFTDREKGTGVVLRIHSELNKALGYKETVGYDVVLSDGTVIYVDVRKVRRIQ